MVRDRLLCVPTSISCTAGNVWDSAEKNAEFHRYNPYLITMDIKNSYPSIDTHRVYVNFKWAFPLHVWTPILQSEEDKDLFIRAVTHLCVAENQLPQWASTSMQIQNIVMRWFDTKIEKKLLELLGSDMIYSRYADDLTISFPHYNTYEVLKEKLLDYENNLLKPTKETIQELMQKFQWDVFIITDNFEFKYLQTKIIDIKEKLQTSRWKWIISEEELYKYIWIINGFKKQIRYSKWNVVDITNELIKIIGWEWRTVNLRKLKTWTPQSNTEREINWLTFDRNGNRALNKKKKSQYIRLLDDIVSLSLGELEDNKYYKKKFEINTFGEGYEKSIKKIQNTVLGVYARLKSVYWENNIPKELLELCNQAKEKWNDYYSRQSKNQKDEIVVYNLKKGQFPFIEDTRSNEEDDIPF